VRDPAEGAHDGSHEGANEGARARAWIKGCSLGCGALLLLIAVGALWLSHAIQFESQEPEISDHHPFRSAAAKRRYLAHYDERARLWPIPSETRIVETSWGQTFVRISGPAAAPPLVLLPGAGATSLQWLPNIEALSDPRRTFAVDNIYDFGRSVYSRRFLSGDDFAQWLDELFDALDLGDDIVLMGLSYGGWITSQYALEHPERLQGIVLLAPAGTVLNLSSGFIKRAVLSAIPHRFFVRNLIFWLAEDSVAMGGPVREQIEAFTEDGYLGLRSFKFKQMVNPYVLSDEELASLEVPVLFLVGEHERIYSASEAVERLSRVAPGIEAEIISGAGHDLTLARAELVNQRVLDFLERRSSDIDPTLEAESAVAAGTGSSEPGR
jgi:pimeloyl-ACP methyl ester carboxylesterase